MKQQCEGCVSQERTQFFGDVSLAKCEVACSTNDRCKGIDYGAAEDTSRGNECFLHILEATGFVYIDQYKSFTKVCGNKYLLSAILDIESFCKIPPLT